MMTSFLYKKDKGLEQVASRADMFAALSQKESLLWVDLEDPTEFESETLVEIFNFHPLAVEDCLSDVSQPKIDDYDEYLFIVMHAMIMAPPSVGEDGEQVVEELSVVELDIFFGRNYVVTFHKTPLKTMQQVREAIQKKPDRYLGYGSDLLVHAILDRLVDNYQPLLDSYEREIDHAEDEIFNNPPAGFLSALMQLKQNVYALRRTMAPQRDLMYTLSRSANTFIKTKHLMYFRDVYDHLFRTYGIVEGFNENIANILQVYFSYASYKLNDIVKHLTVLATLTMPALIIASLYGMNFRYMPELAWPFGYPFAIGVIVMSSVLMLAWMKLKKWL
jgi:magnesium transporter